MKSWKEIVSVTESSNDEYKYGNIEKVKKLIIKDFLSGNLKNITVIIEGDILELNTVNMTSLWGSNSMWSFDELYKIINEKGTGTGTRFEKYLMEQTFGYFKNNIISAIASDSMVFSYQKMLGRPAKFSKISYGSTLIAELK